MADNKIELKSVSELFKPEMKFFIPSYQRGYRWTERQVEDLLNDINDFEPQELPDSKEKTWYCLQPLVVKKMDSTRKKEVNLSEKEEWYEVIDGQQRLTTIFIILNVLDNKHLSLKYQTRHDSEQFLYDIANKKEEANIDFHFMLLAKKTVEKCVEKWKNENENAGDLTEKLKNSCKVIWYETEDKAYEVFKRLNSGKISLSNAELVKALLLKDDNFIGMNGDASRLKQLEIASEWDRMEQTLHDNSFWYFINPEPEDARFNCTRIDFLLEMILRCDIRIVDKKNYTLIYNEKEHECIGLPDSKIQLQGDCEIKEDFLASLSGEGIYSVDVLVKKGFQVFFDFNRLLNQNDYFIFSSYLNRIKEFGWDNTWREIQRFFRIMKAWYDNRQLYHYVGYLMNLKGENKMSMLRNLLYDAEMPKDKFLSSLIMRCQQSIGIGVKQKDGSEITQKNFADWEYGKNNDAIHNVLLLFNLATTQNQISEVSRYPFDKHFEAAKKKWSLEHIHAQNEKPKKEWTIDEINQLKQFAKSFKFIANETDAADKMAEDFVNSINNETIVKEENGQYPLYKIIVGAMMGIGIKRENNTFALTEVFDKDDHLTNMALLQGDKNAAFNNKLFAEKRAKLAEYENVENESFFVPICTRNVFFKHYSPKSTNPFFWDEQAGKEYLSAMVKTIASYLDLETIPPNDYENNQGENKYKYGLQKKGGQQ